MFGDDTIVCASEGRSLDWGYTAAKYREHHEKMRYRVKAITRDGPKRLPRCEAARKLVVRATADLESKKVGNIRPGQRLIVLEEATLDSIIRVRVGDDSTPRGLVVNSLGWVTAVKDGEWVVTPCENADGTSPMWSLSVGSSASPQSANGRKSPSKTKWASVKATRTIAGMRSERSPTRAPSPPPAATGSFTKKAEGKGSPVPSRPRSPSPLTSGSPPPKAKRKVADADDGSPLTLISSAEIRQQSRDLERRAAELVERANGVQNATFERRVGVALIAKTELKPLADLVLHEWDKNKDGDISKMEFRTCVRNSLGLKADNKEIDGLFEKMDADGGGSLDLAEIKTALKGLKDASATAAADAERMHAEAQKISEKAAKVTKVADATEAFEEAEIKLKELQTNPTVESRLGTILATKNWKPVDLLNRWDSDGDGQISRSEFQKHVVEIGVTGAVEEIHALFDKYDADGDGSLDVLELKPIIKRLIDASAAANGAINEATKARGLLQKDAGRAQRELAAMARREAAAEAEAEAAAAKAADDARAADEEKRRQAREAKEAREAQKAAEREEFEAKIAARRAGA